MALVLQQSELIVASINVNIAFILDNHIATKLVFFIIFIMFFSFFAYAACLLMVWSADVLAVWGIRMRDLPLDWTEAAPTVFLSSLLPERESPIFLVQVNDDYGLTHQQTHLKTFFIFISAHLQSGYYYH